MRIAPIFAVSAAIAMTKLEVSRIAVLSVPSGSDSSRDPPAKAS